MRPQTPSAALAGCHTTLPLCLASAIYCVFSGVIPQRSHWAPAPCKAGPKPFTTHICSPSLEWQLEPSSESLRFLQLGIVLMVYLGSQPTDISWKTNKWKKNPAPHLGILHSGPYISGPLYPPLLCNVEISFRAWSSFLSHGLWLQPGDFFVQ